LDLPGWRFCKLYSGHNSNGSQLCQYQHWPFSIEYKAAFPGLWEFKIWSQGADGAWNHQAYF